MKPPKDPTADLYRIMDEAGLTATTLLTTREPMNKLVNSIRSEITRQMKDYIILRETVPQKGKHAKDET